MPAYRVTPALVVALFLMLVPAARAEPTVYFAPPFGENYASEDYAEGRVGETQTDIVCPTADPSDNSAWAHVGLRLSVAQPISVQSDGPVLNTLVRDAVDILYITCPTYIPGTVMQNRQIGFVEIRAPNEVGGRPKLIARVGGLAMGYWAEITDVRAEHARKAAEAAAQREQARAQAIQEQRNVEANAAAAANERAFWHGFWGWVRLAAFGAALLWLCQRREQIARWYYFHFDPHPAREMVRAAIEADDDDEIDGEALADVLGELPPEGRVLRGVRLEQAEQLFGELEFASSRRRRIYERNARANAVERYEHAAFYGSQEALALAAVALEKAKAAYRAATTQRSGAA